MIQTRIGKSLDLMDIKAIKIEQEMKFLGISTTQGSARGKSKSPQKKLTSKKKHVPIETKAKQLGIDLDININLLKWGIEIKMMKKLIDQAIIIQAN